VCGGGPLNIFGWCVTQCVTERNGRSSREQQGVVTFCTWQWNECVYQLYLLLPPPSDVCFWNLELAFCIAVICYLSVANQQRFKVAPFGIQCAPWAFCSCVLQFYGYSGEMNGATGHTVLSVGCACLRLSWLGPVGHFVCKLKMTATYLTLSPTQSVRWLSWLGRIIHSCLWDGLSHRCLSFNSSFLSIDGITCHISF
jgi:hypothetical protein